MGVKSNINALKNSTVVHIIMKMRQPTPNGPARSFRPRPNGSLPRAANLTAPNMPGARKLAGCPPHGQYLAGQFSPSEPERRRLSAHLAGNGISARRLRRLRHDQQRQLMDHPHWSSQEARSRCAEDLLHSRESAWRRQRLRAFDPCQPNIEIPARSSKAARICAHRTTAAAIARRRVMRSRRYLNQPCRI